MFGGLEGDSGRDLNKQEPAFFKKIFVHQGAASGPGCPGLPI